MNRIIAIYDSDLAYSCMLAEGLRAKKEFAFQLLAFTEEEKLCSYISTHYVQLLLVSPDLINERIMGLGVKKIVLLSEELQTDMTAIQAGSPALPDIYKYQPLGNMVCELAKYYRGGEAQPEEEAQPDMQCVVYGVYSPVALLRRDMVMKALLHEYGAGERTLFITLAAFSDRIPEENSGIPDISDAYYYWKQACVQAHIGELIQKEEQFDYIPAALFPEDIVHMIGNDMEAFLTALIRLSGYRQVMIDFAEWGLSAEILSRLCTRQLIPYYENDGESECSLRRYGGYLEMCALHNWKEHTECIPISLEAHSIAALEQRSNG